MLLLPAIQVAALGLILAIVGWRGRLINNHPICRKCSFDLVGIATTALRCPECGWNLRGHDRTATGSRRRRPVLIIIGLLMLITGIGLAVGRHSILPWFEQYRAFENLRAAARGGSFTDQESLLARIQGDVLTPAQMRVLVTDALEMQRDPSVGYRVWGDIFEALVEKNIVTAEQFNGFVQNMLQFELKTRPVVAPGAPLGVELTATLRVPTSPDSRRPSWRQFPWRMRIHSIEGDINADPVTLPLPSYFRQSPDGFGFDYSGHWREMPGVLPLAPTEEGQHTLGITMQLEYAGPLDPNWTSSAATEIKTRWTVDLIRTFEVATDGRSSLIAITDPAAHAAFERDFTGLIILPPRNPAPNAPPKGPHVSITSRVWTPDASLPDAAFDVYLQIRDQEHWLGTMLIDGPRVHTPFLQLDADHPAAPGIAEARLILRPSLDAAHRSLHLKRIWMGPDIIITPEIRQHR